MRRVALYGAGWLAAAAVAVLLAWQGVGRVGISVTDRHPRPLSADQAREALAGGAAPSANPAPDPGAVNPPAPPATGNPVPTRPSPTRTTVPSRPVPPAPSPTTAPTTVTTRPAAPATTTTTAGVLRTYNLVGGSVTLRFDPSGKVTVVWANPNPGFRVEVDDRSDGGVRVRFDSDSHRSQVEAWWSGGPQDQVEESGGGGGGGSGPG